MTTRALVKASGGTVHEVHGVDKELDPHIMPGQQYVSKVAMPKGTRPKTMKTLVRDSPHKTGLETKSYPVRTPQLTDKAEIASKSPRPHQKMPYSSPKVSSIQPKPFSVGTQQQGDSNGESIEKEKEIDESDVDLKFTRRKYNLGIDMGEGQEYWTMRLKYQKNQTSMNHNPLNK